MTRIAINRFGRIGRHVLWRVARREPGIEVAVVNSIRAEPEVCAHLLKYDSVFGRYPGEVAYDEHHLIVDERTIRVTNQPDPWHAFDIDVVVEATGRFTHRDDAVHHLRAGARQGPHHRPRPL